MAAVHDARDNLRDVLMVATKGGFSTSLTARERRAVLRAASDLVRAGGPRIGVGALLQGRERLPNDAELDTYVATREAGGTPAQAAAAMLNGIPPRDARTFADARADARRTAAPPAAAGTGNS